MKRLLVFALLSVLISACTLYQIDSQDSTLDYFPSKDAPGEVTYIENVTRPHTVIGTVIVNAERRQYLSEVLEKMQVEAAELGGDAITNIKTDDGTGKWAEIKPRFFKNSNVRSDFIADVVVFQ